MIGKKSRLFRRFIQHSAICHFSKYIRLAARFSQKQDILEEMYVVSTPPSFKKNSPKETRENSMSVLLFVLMLTS